MPSLDLRFAETKSLTDWISGQNLITFTRASSATVVNAAGALETVASNLPRLTHNPLTGESLGLLLEEQRTNLLLNSATLSTQNVTVTAVAHTLSFTGTGTVTLSGVSTAGPLVGTGAGEANRVSLTFTPTAGTLTLTVSGTVTDAQLEAGSSRTTYIPTTGATATRSADVASITGANFSSWYRQDEGTVFADARSNGSAGSERFPLIVQGSTFDDRWAVGVASTNQYQTFYALGGAAQANLTTGSLTDSSGFRIASVSKANDIAMVVNGGATLTDSSASLITANQLGIGRAAQYLNGTIRRLTYWPQRLPNNTLIALTR